MGCFSISSVIIISNLNSNVKRKSISRTESNHPRVSEPKFLFLLFVSGWEVHPNRLPSSTGRELKGILSSSLTLSDYSIRYRWSIVKSFFKVSLRYSEVLKDIHEPRHTQYTKPKRKCQVFFSWKTYRLGMRLGLSRALQESYHLAWYSSCIPQRTSEVFWDFWYNFCIPVGKMSLKWGLSQQKLTIYSNI